MASLNPNAKPFKPSGQSYGPIIESDIKSEIIIPGSLILTKLNQVPIKEKDKIENDKIEKGKTEKDKENDFITKLINSKHILISRISNLENNLKIKNNENQKLILQITESEKKYFEENKKLNNTIIELNSQIKKLSEDIEKLENDNSELQIVQTNFNKLKIHIGDFIKIKEKKFQDELDQKNAEIEKINKELLDMNLFYTYYIGTLKQQILQTPA
jgi:hypothetical protein